MLSSESDLRRFLLTADTKSRKHINSAQIELVYYNVDQHLGLLDETVILTSRLTAFGRKQIQLVSPLMFICRSLLRIPKAAMRGVRVNGTSITGSIV